MLKLLKRVFCKEKNKLFTPKNQEIIEKLQLLLYSYNTAYLINRPHSKILIMNVYYESFDALLANIVNRADNRVIAAVNVYSYFKNYYTESNIKYSLERIISILQENDINVKVQHDLEEIVGTVEFLVGLEKGLSSTTSPFREACEE